MKLDRLGILAAAATLAWSCATATSARSDGLVGCYQFERNEGARTLGLPWGFELEDAPLGPGWPLMAARDGVRRASTATGPAERDDHPFGYWLPTPPDSVEIGHPGGGGVVLHLGRSGQDLIGAGIAAGDATAPGTRPAPAPVIARRVLCGAA